jgi:hypothetical protein
MRNNRCFKSGQQFEEWLFGRSYQRPNIRPFLVENQFSEFARKVIAIAEEEERFPKTSFAMSLYYNVQTYLKRLSIATDGLRLFASVGSEADVYYFTDALFYLSYAGHEFVVSIDSFLVKNILALRDFWIEASSSFVFTEEEFQSCLFRHKMLVSEFLKNTQGGKETLRVWILSDDYKKIWISGREVYFYKKIWISGKEICQLLDDPDRSNRRPENHFLITPWHLPMHRRRELAKCIANSLVKQICGTAT